MMSFDYTIRTQSHIVINVFSSAIYETKQNTTRSTMNLCPTNIDSRDNCVMVLWIAASTCITTIFGFNVTIWFMRRNWMTTIFADSVHLISLSHLYPRCLNEQLVGGIEKGLAADNGIVRRHLGPESFCSRFNWIFVYSTTITAAQILFF